MEVREQEKSPAGPGGRGVLFGSGGWLWLGLGLHLSLGEPNVGLAPNIGLGEGGTTPTLFIHKRCGRLIETLPALQHDPNRPEDALKVDADEEGNGGDDAADALRYMLATRPMKVYVRKLRGA